MVDGRRAMVNGLFSRVKSLEFMVIKEYGLGFTVYGVRFKM
jgi:hypothetical protein